ncbi:MAG: sialate O-acetylesterase [Planctomycetota bacterium]|jgi:sialate O-acetylesterase
MSYKRIGFVKRVVFILSLVLLLVDAGAVFADVKLPAVISDNMVLQRGMKVPIWGWAEPGEKVEVRFGIYSYGWRTTTDKDGKWMVKISPLQAGGPFEMFIKGNNTITLKNILVGEVWVCSGQSNMQWSVKGSADAEQEIAAADYPSICLFAVERKVAEQPQSDCVGSWESCSPQTVPGFSAVAYFFGRELHKELNVPIGLIHTSWGGTVAEAWTSSGALKKLPDFKAAIEKIEQVRVNPELFQKKYERQMLEWQKKIDFSGPDGGPEGKGCTDVDFDDGDWKQMELPKLWEQAGLANFDGLMWFRKEVEVPKSWIGKELILELGPIDDMDVTWINGIRVGGLETPGRWKTNRKYKIDSKVIRSGRNVVAVRVLDTGGGGGIYGRVEQMKLKPAGAADDVAISLSGRWRYKKGYDLRSMPPQPRPPLRISHQNAPTALYNGMIAPLIPYGIQGAIWYQGESNAGRAYQYRKLFGSMIKNWRNDWGQGDFSFLFVQLANFMAVNPEPVESAWAELREAQLMTLALPKTGMAVIIDIGEANDIHPKNKQDVGKRLALWALGGSYRKKLVYCGPIYKSMRVESNKIILHFDHVGGGLVAGGGKPLKGFAVAGADRKFVWADAKIDGDTVVVSSDKISEPVAVRYAWANNPVCNLYNKEGLPASPFRTDDWPGITVGKK